MVVCGSVEEHSELGSTRLPRQWGTATDGFHRLRIVEHYARRGAEVALPEVPLPDYAVLLMLTSEAMFLRLSS